jgi:tRNA threonylcarbamoyladenosine biosynthesis protein TsaB
MTATLAIVTCGPQLEVALRSGDRAVPSHVRLAGVSPRSTLLLAAVDLLVEDAGLEPGAIRRVVIGRGPGSFTGIRSGLATAQGLAAANSAEIVAYDSLLMQAARCGPERRVWAAQPGRRGEVYARLFEVPGSSAPRARGEIEIVSVDRTGDRGPWIAAETLDLGSGERTASRRGAAEALLRLVDRGADPQSVEPLYVEAPPIHGTS